MHLQLYFMIPKRDDAYLMAMRHKTKTGNRSSSVERTGCVSGPDHDVSETFGRNRFRLYEIIEVYDVMSYHGGLVHGRCGISHP